MRRDQVGCHPITPGPPEKTHGGPEHSPLGPHIHAKVIPAPSSCPRGWGFTLSWSWCEGGWGFRGWRFLPQPKSQVQSGLQGAQDGDYLRRGTPFLIEARDCKNHVHVRMAPGWEEKGSSEDSPERLLAMLEQPSPGTQGLESDGRGQAVERSGSFKPRRHRRDPVD